MYRFRIPAFPGVVFIAMLLSSTMTRATGSDVDEAIFEDLEDLPESFTENDEANEIENRMQLLGHERRQADTAYLHPLLPPLPARRNFVESVAYYAKPRNPYTPYTNIIPLWTYESRYPFFLRRSMPVNRRTTTTATYSNYPSSADQMSPSAKQALSTSNRGLMRSKPGSYYGGTRSQRRNEGVKRAADEEKYPAEWGACMEWVLNNLRICKVAAVLKSLQGNLQKRNDLMKDAFQNGYTEKKPSTMSVVVLLAAVDEALKRMNEKLLNVINSHKKDEKLEADAEEEEEEAAEEAFEDDAEALDANAADEDTPDEEEAAKEDEEAEALDAKADAEEAEDDAEAAEDDDDSAKATAKKKDKDKKKKADEDSRRKANDKKRRPLRRFAKTRKKKADDKAPNLRSFVDENVELQGSGSDSSVFKEDFGNRIFVDDVEDEREPAKSNSGPGSMVPNIRGDFARRTAKNSRRNANDTKSTVRPARKESSKSAGATSPAASAKSKKGVASKSQTMKGPNSTTPVAKDEGSPIAVENRMFQENATLSVSSEKATTDSANRSAV